MGSASGLRTCSELWFEFWGWTGAKVWFRIQHQVPSSGLVIQFQVLSLGSGLGLRSQTLSAGFGSGSQSGMWFQVLGSVLDLGLGSDL